MCCNSLYSNVLNLMKRATITIYQRKEDQDDLKKMILDLKKQSGDRNPFRGRSESEIAKLILAKGLKEEHRNICG